MIYRIRGIDASTKKTPLYFLEDLLGDKILRRFYRQEIFPTKKPSLDHQFRIEKVLGPTRTITRNNKRVKQTLVKWQWYPAKFNEYVDTDDIVLPKTYKAGDQPTDIPKIISEVPPVPDKIDNQPTTSGSTRQTPYEAVCKTL